MRDRGEILTASFPRPGRTLKAVLVTIAACAILGGVVVNWVPGGPTGVELLGWVAFQPSLALTRPWTFVTSGIVTDPTGVFHALWSILGLYFLGPDLEQRWGGARFVRFLLAAVLAGNLAVFLVGLIPSAPAAVHPAIAYGPLAAIEACAFAWGKENAHRHMRFMFFLEMSGRTFMWITVGFAVVALVFLRGMAEGAVAPLGGVAVGWLLAGSPSPVRALWLRLKLAFLRRKGPVLTVESLTGTEARGRRRTKSGPSLRVLRGGADDSGDDDPPREPREPRDKRYLN